MTSVLQWFKGSREKLAFENYKLQLVGTAAWYALRLVPVVFFFIAVTLAVNADSNCVLYLLTSKQLRNRTAWHKPSRLTHPNLCRQQIERHRSQKML